MRSFWHKVLCEGRDVEIYEDLSFYLMNVGLKLIKYDLKMCESINFEMNTEPSTEPSKLAKITYSH